MLLVVCYIHIHSHSGHSIVLCLHVYIASLRTTPSLETSQLGAATCILWRKVFYTVICSEHIHCTNCHELKLDVTSDSDVTIVQYPISWIEPVSVAV